ncbi:TPA: hypothetical protein ACHWKL_004089 [Providencia stuartii]|uniref:DUF1641 domain-containing protein n=2 Tax=Providencia stuartii TaxID=588 RepID=A0AAJ1N4R9_PROST|nr:MULTISPECIES: hypothetical protein [Providencia]AFH93020.1 hypothetical protein S70_05730 [Providencia stuartii MRSN 2154]AIN62732.1 hypothetical protein DR96_249 [Providencia stuartii]AMG68549.1 hypothetical protein AL507_19045 [Providencia stuartii]APG50993.1 hypothetical protein BGK56_08535 [Providencia stuartii]AVE40769.1 hypothetical protein AM353_02320 [Providencia stuartii]
MSNENTHSKLIELLNSESVDHFAEKISPLLHLKRLDNIVDLLSLVSDLVDILDLGTVEKLSNSFEDTLTPVWELGTAYNMAKMEAIYDDKTHNFRSVYSLLKDPNTLRGISILLRTLQIMGSRIPQSNEK